MQKITVLITGGAGFIGSRLIHHVLKSTNYHVVNVDNLTYAGNLESLFSLESNSRYFFEKADICDPILMNRIFNKYKPDIIFHLAAESHVDKSILAPNSFIQTNILGTYTLLEQARAYWSNLKTKKKDSFKLIHISTDEVYGDLGNTNGLFTEDSPYAPSSPYSASKASSDHLAKAWHRTYNLPVLITNCSNNYGPYQFPEKLIPLVILNAINGKKIPVYGDGHQIRDWLYVDDHVEALLKIALNAKTGQSYNIGGRNELKNIDVVNTICDILNDLEPPTHLPITKYQELITHVDDRSGHDLRYAIDFSKLENDLGWKPKENFETGIKKTIQWYLDNLEWCKIVIKK